MSSSEQLYELGANPILRTRRRKELGSLLNQAEVELDIEPSPAHTIVSFITNIENITTKVVLDFHTQPAIEPGKQ